MTQREALLAGAKKCLVNKGYGGTTARDIASTASANLGSIGYYFGSKDRLMNLAAIELSGEWGDALERAARAAGGDTRAERLRALLTELLAMIPQSQDLQSASLQALTQSKFDDELRGEIAAGHARGRAELAAIVLGTQSTDPDSPTARGLGTLVYALVTGLVAQAVVDPESLPDSDLLADALDAVIGG
ncbi:TetR family transcriptional regulator [Haloactinopolyspora alba]|uniref:TetR family transcriptional regulator n=1 Tax=Haloactinopolyspora alba TaxID=648780 RepID=A0A2P8D3T1_9ACTN|nr:TetR/AcrR family transcriptional regulator [Haloactinopolyspora alba]PSK91883.1 TetR family transcriptional regulator [Haloactinopolyspora alba]